MSIFFCDVNLPKMFFQHFPLPRYFIAVHYAIYIGGSWQYDDVAACILQLAMLLLKEPGAWNRCHKGILSQVHNSHGLRNAVCIINEC